MESQPQILNYRIALKTSTHAKTDFLVTELNECMQSLAGSILSRKIGTTGALVLPTKSHWFVFLG